MKINKFRVKIPENFPNEKFYITLTLTDENFIRIRAERITNKENTRFIQTIIPKIEVDIMKSDTSVIDEFSERYVNGICSCLAVPNNIYCKERFTNVIISTLHEFLTK